MEMRKGDIIDLTVDRMAFGGQGIARLDGLVIFVKGGIPGDKVKAFIFTKKKAYAEAKIQELLAPSADRIQAPCPYFGTCGGCQWQQVKYERQLEYKRAHVEEALSHIGSLSGIEILDAIPSEKRFGYRNKMEFSFSDRPWLPYPPSKIPPPLTPPTRGGEFFGLPPARGGEFSGLPPARGGEFFGLPPARGGEFSDLPPTRGGEFFGLPPTRGGEFSGLPPARGGESNGTSFLPLDGGGEVGVKRQSSANFVLGLHVSGTFDRMIDVEACLLQQERGNEILREVKRFARESGLPPYGLKSHEGFWRFLTLRHSAYHDDWMVNLVTSEMRTEVLLALARRLTGRFPNVKTVVNNITSRKASIAVGEREVVLTGAGTIVDRIGASTFQISANSFFQTNSLGAERLYEKVVEFAELTGRETVLDLYSGTGTIPIFLAKSATRVIGMEIAESSVLDARRNCEANGIENCEFILGDIRESLTHLRIHPEVMIIDPPRAGMHQDVLSRVLEIGAERIVYVSCNPPTLARDLAQMQEHYHVTQIQPVDMFPHTYHVESVAKLIKRSNGILPVR
jgi:23S rRNA (uracil-5-)-methyltransferase RumA